MNTKYAVCSDIGRVRNINQDNFYLNGFTADERIPIQVLSDQSDQTVQIFAVCDGMGGEQHGEKAALFAVDTLKKYHTDNFDDNWRSYIKEANKVICSFSKKNNCYTGTTAACIYLKGNTLQGFNIGDTRIYQIRDDEIVQLSVDHTEFQIMVDAGFLRKEDFSRSKSHNYLTQHLGIEPKNMLIEPAVTNQIEVEEGDRYLICTDGLYGVVSDEEMLQILREESDVEQCCDRLSDYAREKKSKDNITALVLEIPKQEVQEESVENQMSEEEVVRIEKPVQLQGKEDVINIYTADSETGNIKENLEDSVFSQTEQIQEMIKQSKKRIWFKKILVSVGGIVILMGMILLLK